MNKKAFTLAEVLITLSILGVVAAITIPNVIGNYKKTMTETKLKMIYSQLSNIVDQMNIEYAPVSQLVDESFSGRSKNDATNYFVETYLKKYLKYSALCEVPKYSCNIFDITSYDGRSADNNGLRPKQMYEFKLNNGMYLGISWIGSNTFGIAVDINGKTKPNKVGYDIFYFAIHGANSEAHTIYRNDVDCGRAQEWDTSVITWAKENKCEGNGMSCTCPIMKNGWKIPKDYPVKF